MATPVDNFKNSLFGQLKSYSDAVQGAFEQRIARPLIALKRDLSRPSSTTRTSLDQESVSPSQQTSFATHQELVSSSSPIEIIDIETNHPKKTILDRIKNNVLSSSTTEDDAKRTTRNHRQSSISSMSNKSNRKNRLCHYKSVSFAEQVQYDNDSSKTIPYSTDNKKELIRNVHTLTDHSTIANIDEGTANQIKPTDKSSTFQNSANDFDRNFRQVIRPRRISIGNNKDLVYQDLSAEIVAYVLKHALRILEKEDEDLLLAENHNVINQNEQDDDIIDLK